jgi:hypothetical protein
MNVQWSNEDYVLLAQKARSQGKLEAEYVHDLVVADLHSE